MIVTRGGALSPVITSGHGPYSHLFDGIFIPTVSPGTDWHVRTAVLVTCLHARWLAEHIYSGML